jgi:tripartite-type tricarboxylate transporter receptor subunit TctC
MFHRKHGGGADRRNAALSQPTDPHHRAQCARLNGEIVKMMADPPFAQRIVDQGQEPQATTPADFLKYAKSEQVRWAEVIKKAGLKLER